MVDAWTLTNGFFRFANLKFLMCFKMCFASRLKEFANFGGTFQFVFVVFITLKDHQKTLFNNPTYRLINPSTNELGKISKHINKDANNHLAYNKWKNTFCFRELFKHKQKIGVDPTRSYHHLCEKSIYLNKWFRYKNCQTLLEIIAL